MTEDSDQAYWGYLSPKDISLTKQFLNDGYIVIDVEDNVALREIRTHVAESVAKFLGIETKLSEDLLNGFHDIIDTADLNDLRVHLIQKLNDQQWLGQRYFQLARSALEHLVGNELSMQRQVNLSIQLPHDDSSLLPVHADVWSGDSPFEVVVWLPLVDCYGTKSMFLLPPEPTSMLHKGFNEFVDKSSEAIFRSIEKDLTWFDIPYGKILIFNQTLPHGNRINRESETRWTMNCRFKSVFSPYGDKKIGEFFVPVTLRAASRIGMSYSYPGDS